MSWFSDAWNSVSNWMDENIFNPLVNGVSDFFGGFYNNNSSFKENVDKKYGVDPGTTYNPYNPLGIGSTVGNVLGNVATGVENAWYSLTGQTEKTSAYKHLEEKENTAIQRQVADMRAAGLSPYYFSGNGAGSASSAGMGQTTGLATMNALVDILSKKAQIDNVEAQTAHTKADTDSIVARNGFLPDLLNIEVAEGHARVELTKNQGQQVAEDILSKISARTIAEAEHLMNMKIKSQEYNWFGLTASQKINVMQAQIQNYASEVAKREAEIYHLSREDELLVQDLYMRSLETEIMKYNYDYSAEHGIRTTDSPTKVGGVNLDQLASNLKKVHFSWKDGFYFRDPSQGSGGGYAW